MRTAQSFAALLLPLALGACKGDKDKGEETGVPVVPTPFVTTGAALSATGTVPQLDTLSYQANITLWAATTVAASNDPIQGIMFNNAPAPAPPPEGGPRGVPCWEVTGTFPASKTVEFAACDVLGIYGSVAVEDLASGPMRMVFRGALNPLFELSGRTVDGALRFEPNDELTWTVGGGDPSSANAGPAPVVYINSTDVTLDFQGRAQALFGSGQLGVWGKVDASSTLGTSSFYYGATSVAQAEALTSSPAFTRYDFFPADCRCPTTGSTVFPETTLSLTELSIDLDDLKATDDGFDDPVISIAVTDVLDLSLLVGPAEECGTLQAVATAAGTGTVSVSGFALGEAIDAACSRRDITDEAHCADLSAGADAASPIEIDLSAVLNEVSAKAFQSGTQPGWCVWPLPQQ